MKSQGIVERLTARNGNTFSRRRARDDMHERCYVSAWFRSSGDNQGAAAGWVTLKIGRQLIRRNALWIMTKAMKRVQEYFLSVI
jgi:hypothetical protein